MDKLPVELQSSLEKGGWVAEGDGFKRGEWFVTMEPSSNVHGSWKWTVAMRDRNEVRTNYGVTKSLSEFLRFGV